MTPPEPTEHEVVPAALAEYCEQVRQRRMTALQPRKGSVAEFNRVVLAACRPKPIEHEAPTMEQVKENAILKALDRNGGVIQRAADELKIGRNTIYDTLKRVGSAGVLALLALVAMLGTGCAGIGDEGVKGRKGERVMPPMPRATRSSAGTDVEHVARAVSAPAKTLRLEWNKNDSHQETVTQVWATEDFETWELFGEFAEPYCLIEANRPRQFFKIRNRLGNELSEWAKK